MLAQFIWNIMRCMLRWMTKGYSIDRILMVKQWRVWIMYNITRQEEIGAATHRNLGDQISERKENYCVEEGKRNSYSHYGLPVILRYIFG